MSTHEEALGRVEPHVAERPKRSKPLLQRDWWRQKGLMDEVEWTLDRALDR